MVITPVVKMKLMVIPQALRITIAQVLRMMTPLRRVMAVVTLETTYYYDVPVSIC